MTKAHRKIIRQVGHQTKNEEKYFMKMARGEKGVNRTSLRWLYVYNTPVRIRKRHCINESASTIKKKYII